MLIVYGLIKILGYFSRDIYCLAFQFDLAFGVLLAAVGIIIIVRRNVVVNLIFGIFGLLILADALFKIQMSIDAKKFGLNLWWRILLVAILTGVLGFLLLIRPFEAAEIMMILVGVSVLFSDSSFLFYLIDSFVVLFSNHTATVFHYHLAGYTVHPSIHE